jgi:hypothetical protein
MTEARNSPTATLLADGRVLVTGGRNWDADGNLVILASAEIFDPATNTFERLSTPMNDSRWVHTATRLQDGRVLILGGLTQGRGLASGEVFDPVTREFTGVGAMAHARNYHTATPLPNGQVLIVGVDTELFDPAASEFQSTGALTTERFGHNAIALPDGRVAILGGLSRNDIPAMQVELYDPATGQFSPQGELAEGRAFAEATLLPDGRILIAGGSQWHERPTALRSIEIYDPATGQSAIVGTLTIRRSHIQSAVLTDGRVLIAGGHNQVGGPWTPMQTAELVDPATGSAARTDAMSRPRAEGASVRLQDGRILILGGFTTGLDILRTAETYVP